jgi:hypothetical protein
MNNMMFFEVKSFSELEDYMDWLEKQDTYPIQFYINGVCYEIKDKRSKLFLCVGQEIIFNVIGEIIQ